VTDFTADGNIVVSGVTVYEGGTTDDLLILTDSTADSFNFNGGLFTVTNPGSAFKVGSSDSTVKSIYVKKSSTGEDMACATNDTPGTSSVTLPTAAAGYYVYPSANTDFATTDCCSAVSHAATYVAFPVCGPATCDAGYYVKSGACAQIGGGGVSGGGGGYSATAPVMPTTTTGQVSATAAAGGKTTLITGDSTAITATLPANSLGSDAVITLAEVSKTAADVLTETGAIPGTMLMVGGSIYRFTAMTGTTNVTIFNQPITLTFTYTDAQIAGVSENSLRVYYWNTTTSAWTAIATTINAATNTLTVTTNHFTDFAIFSGSGISGQNIPEGALIRAIGDIDIYIVKYVGSKQFKRLILSPSVFNSYQHLKWGDVLDVDKSVVDSFTTSELVRAVNDTKVYKLYPAGDTGERRWVKTAEGFNRMNFDWDAIYEINAVDRNSYVAGSNIE
jgi:hypothetical protein